MLLVDPNNFLTFLHPTFALFHDLSLAPIFLVFDRDRGESASFTFGYQRSASFFLKASRPREIRDFTVPTPHPNAAAVSS